MFCLLGSAKLCFLCCLLICNWLINHTTFQRLGKPEGAKLPSKGIQNQSSVFASGNLWLTPKGRRTETAYSVLFYHLGDSSTKHKSPLVSTPGLVTFNFSSIALSHWKLRSWSSCWGMGFIYFRFMAAINSSHILSKTEEVFVTFILHKIRWSVTITPSGELDCGFYRLQLVENLPYPQVNSPALKICSLSVVWTCLAGATSLWSVMHLYVKLKSPLPLYI